MRIPKRTRARSARIHYEPLGSDDAARIARLQQRLFPPELRESVAEVRQILLNTEEHMLCNLSFGVFDNARLVGYMFVYVETHSIFYQRDEEVLYIKEIALLPGYETCLRPLFFKLYEQWLAFVPGMPLEAHATAEALGNWRRMARVFRYFGLTLTDSAEVRREGRPPYQLLRLDVADGTASLYKQPKALPGCRSERADGIAVSVVTEPRQWLSLRDVWDDLLIQTADSSVFQSFDYLWQWWRYFGFWNDLYIVVIRRHEKVIGIVPMMREYFPVFGKVARKLVFITSPMEMSRPKLIFGRHADLCWPAFLDYIKEISDAWDIVDIDEQLIHDETASMRTYVKSQRWLIADSETLCPYIDLSGTWTAFTAKLPRKMRSNINRMRRRVAELGEIRVRCVNTWPALDAAMDTHTDVEARSWKAAKGLDLSSDKAYFYYYRSLAQCFGRDGRFEQRILEYDGKAIASTFGLVCNGVFQSLKIAHDSAYDRYSPGTVLESYELELLFATNLKCYEFMGSFLTNKLRWTSSVYRTENIHIYQRQPRLMLFYFTYFILKRRIAKVLKHTGQFERADRILKKFRANPFPRY